MLRAPQISRCSRLLVCEGAVDHAIGILRTKEVLPPALQNQPISVRSLMAPALIVPDRTSVLQPLDRFRRDGIHMAVVGDEYGTTEGIARTEGRSVWKEVTIREDLGSPRSTKSKHEQTI